MDRCGSAGSRRRIASCVERGAAAMIGALMNGDVEHATGGGTRRSGAGSFSLKGSAHRLSARQALAGRGRTVDPASNGSMYGQNDTASVPNARARTSQIRWGHPLTQTKGDPDRTPGLYLKMVFSSIASVRLRFRSRASPRAVAGSRFIGYVGDRVDHRAVSADGQSKRFACRSRDDRCARLRAFIERRKLRRPRRRRSRSPADCRGCPR